MTARVWLQENGYDDVVALIEKVEKGWKVSGASTRRNWWGILAGGSDGRPRAVSDIMFPVLASAQIHEGKPVTNNAIKRKPGEVPPQKDYRGRSAIRRRRGRRRAA